jgi:hypothetical protein
MANCFTLVHTELQDHRLTQNDDDPTPFTLGSSYWARLTAGVKQPAAA